MSEVQQAYSPTQIEQEAAALLKREITTWDTAAAFITEKVAFQMRNLIRALRKNYWGVFDKPKDEMTNREKIWIPLTESTVESVVKNIDLDTKDINFRAKKPEAVGLTNLVRHLVRNELDEMNFGEILDMTERQLAIDGTIVWKTTEEVRDDGKKYACVKIVDLLNWYIDPTASCIKETTVIERAVTPLDEFKSMKGLINLDLVKGQTNLNRNDAEQQFTAMGNSQGQTEEAEVFERWGKMSKFLMTGKEEDRNKQVDGHIIASRNAGAWMIHLVEQEKNSDKPYEEAWYTRVPGRWYGKGIAEKLYWLQLWINTIVNIRINRSYVSQLGIFKIKRNAGITPPMVQRLAANGAIMVNDTKDIEQFVMQEASQASYTDEANIYSWTQRVTSAYEAVTGEALPASTSATATALQGQGAQSQFVLIKEGIGMFLERWIHNKLMLIITKNLTAEQVVRITGDTEELRELDERIVNEMLYQEIHAMNVNGFFLDPMQVEAERQSALQKLSAHKERFVTLMEKIDFLEYDTKVYVTNEEFDKGVMLKDLLAALQVAPEYRDQILQATFDIMGIGPLKKPPMPAMPQMGMGAGAPGAPAGAPMPVAPGAPEAPTPMNPGTQVPSRAVTAANTRY